MTATPQTRASSSDRLDVSVMGGFEDGRGAFFAGDTEDARPKQARWEQAFSVDGGATWETDRTMDFTRIPA